MRFDEFDARLSRLLRALPDGTIAELTDGMIAWWGGARTVYAWIGDGGLDQPGARELDLADDWGQFHDWLAAWIDEPRFSTRPEKLGRDTAHTDA
ncbi:hypothetical protein [Paraburkholderia hospita]|uniref:hypothetical protein n=1 Tax=Paraburkholderia hospita TaxID=169430 RepID=UPI000DEFFF98|nr:hypothetical protein [Paraburkholderia hospita]AXF03565.1 hypothetical protein CUJ88_34100 [Paraburkholderia hospita]